VEEMSGEIRPAGDQRPKDRRTRPSDNTRPVVGTGRERRRRQASRRPLLSGEQELELARRYRDEGDKKAFDTLAESNIGLVNFIARGYCNRGLDLADLVQEGHVGLMRAVEKFDYTAGCKFSTYAVPWIRTSIQRAVAAQGGTLALPPEKLGRLRKRQAELQRDLGRELTPEDLVESFDGDDAMTPQDIHSLLDASQPASSIDIRVGDGGSCAISDLIADERVDDPASEVMRKQLREQLQAVLGGLSDRERQIIESRFSVTGEPRLTLDEVGKRLGLSGERVRQLERRAMRSLRKTFEDRGMGIEDLLVG
jgi:RNA polymerase primary sigma factor